MALLFDFPEYVDDVKNPAERWIADVEAELGFAEPRLNGNSLLMRRSTFGAAAGGSGETWAINEPVIRIIDRTGTDYVALHPAISYTDLQGNEIDEADPRDEQGETAWNLTRFQGVVLSEAVNRFSWIVTIPPPGPWTAAAPPKRAAEIAQHISQEQTRKGTPNPVAAQAAIAIAQSGADAWRIELVGGPMLTIGQIRRHTRRHETQHVIDHIKVIRTMFGPWDNYISGLKRNNTTITGSSRSDVHSAISNARGFDPLNPHQAYTPGIRRIGAQVVEELVWSGRQYHNTPSGYPCGRSVVSFANRTLRIQLSIGTLLPDQTFATVEQLELVPSLWTWRETYIHG
jgi:hypothetical protein